MGSKGMSKEEMKQEHPLQAIVLCDSWGEEARWGPLVRRSRTEEEEYDDVQVGGEQRPWCLLPLLDKPLLAWTLECLSASGVDEVFVFVREGADEVRAYIQSSSFVKLGSSLSIVVRPTTAPTPGDILREVDGLGILAPVDYLVVQAGYVGNIDLKEKVEEFTAKRVADPSLTMSCVVSPRQVATNSTYAVHVLADDGQLFHYEESQVFPKRKQASLPKEALGGAKDVRVRVDLESVGVAICSIEVAPLFTENFDYQFFYPDFVNGLLTSDLLGKTICCTVVDPETEKKDTATRSASWAGVVGNTRSYDQVSNCILSRRAYPLVPDENMPDEGDRYEQRRARVYYSDELDLARTTKVGSSSLLARGVNLGPDTSISHSVLGSSVSVAASSSVTGSYVFAGARIGEKCVIRDSVIGEGAVVGDNSTVDGGSLIGAGVVLGPASDLSGQRVSTEEPAVEAGPSRARLGEGSQAYIWPTEDQAPEDSDSDDDEAKDPRNLALSRLGTGQLNSLLLEASGSNSSLSSMSRASSDGANSDSETDSDEEGRSTAGRTKIAGLDVLNDDDSDPLRDFVSECTQSLDRSFAEGHTVDNAAIELKTLRMASNVDLAEVRKIVVPYLLRRAERNSALVPQLVERWGGLISSLTGEGEGAMVHCILEAQRFVATQLDGDMRFFLLTLKGFYEEDVVTDDSVFAWYKDPRAREVGDDMGRKLWAGARGFVEMIAESDSDDDEDDEEEEEESD